ncbi:glutamate receptor ionotropic, delta-1 [Trichonephila clavipes]|uniref:Glutamate receptor ionotropic, delta-1 n=1 Tax=Trichonephila clavipes TaxID=2585209 RepID=A0A8X6WIS1_TRICX|nr:glutamate receptor ionotropic, delta-1 [Trichonephila clavipes]
MSILSEVRNDEKTLEYIEKLGIRMDCTDSMQEDLRIILESMNSDPRNLVSHDVDGLAECLRRDYAYVGGELTVRADIWDPKLFLFAKDSFLQYGYAIAFAPDFNHIDLFNHKIRQLQEGGIIVKWMEDIIERQQFRGTMKVDKSDEDEGKMHVLNVDDVQGAFAILSIECNKHLNSNSRAQQPLRARAYCAHHRKRDHWALRCMSRCPDQVVNLQRDFRCLSPQASLVLIYRPTAVGMKG